MKTLNSLCEKRNRIESELKNIIAELARCRPHRIMQSARIVDDLGIDSFTALEILVAVENSYGIKIAETAISNLSTFGQVVEFVCERVLNKAQKS